MVADDSVPKCPTCGGDPQVCGDPDQKWFAQRDVCYRDRERKTAQRLFELVYDEHHQFHDGTGAEWSKEATRKTPTRFDDGVTISVTPTDESPGETWLEKRQA